MENMYYTRGQRREKELRDLTTTKPSWGGKAQCPEGW